MKGIFATRYVLPLSVIIVAIAFVVWNNQGETHSSGGPDDEITAPTATASTGGANSREAGRAKATRKASRINDLDEAEKALLEFHFEGYDDLDGLKPFRLLARVAQIDPALYEPLMLRMESASSPGWREFMIKMAIYREWAKNDWDVALSHASGKADRKELEQSLESVFSGLAENSPEQAMKLAQGLHDSLKIPADDLKWVTKEVAQAIYRTWLRSDPAGAVGWTDSLPPGKDRSQYLVNGLIEWSQTDRSAALRRAEAMPDDEWRRNVYGNISWQWTKFDPKGAKGWIDGLPEGKSRKAALISHQSAISEKSP